MGRWMPNNGPDRIDGIRKQTVNAMNGAKTRIEVYDTTLRDGAQAEGVSFSLEDKLVIAERLDALGVDYIEGGYPLSNPKDEAFFKEIRHRSILHAKVAAFGMTRRKGVKPSRDAGMNALLASDAPVVTIVGKSWRLHVDEVLRADERENLDMITESLAFFREHGREVIYDAEHFFDGYRADAEYAMRTVAAAVESGAPRVVLCDTNGGSLPEFVGQVVREVRRRFPQVKVGIHCHNDGGLAVANTLAAVAAGAEQVQGTVNGIGERCGNADLTAVIPNLALKAGYDCLREGALASLTAVSRFIYEVANMNFQDNQPFVGSAAFAHKGGMHVHAVRRNTRTYEHLPPELVGNARRILVSELSGVSNIAAAAPAKFNIAGDKEAQRKILSALMSLEKEGYQFEAAEASFEMLIRRTLGEPWYRSLWKLDHYRCVIYKHGERANTEAIVKVTVGDVVEHRVAEGEGPFDSLHKALCAALSSHYPQVMDLHLVDYRVRVVNTAAETAARVRVMVDWHDSSRTANFGTVGVSENIIDASWLALVDAIEYKLMEQPEAHRSPGRQADLRAGSPVPSAPVAGRGRARRRKS